MFKRALVPPASYDLVKSGPFLEGDLVWSRGAQNWVIAKDMRIDTTVAIEKFSQVVARPIKAVLFNPPKEPPVGYQRVMSGEWKRGDIFWSAEDNIWKGAAGDSRLLIDIEQDATLVARLVPPENYELIYEGNIIAHDLSWSNHQETWLSWTSEIGDNLQYVPKPIARRIANSEYKPLTKDAIW